MPPREFESIPREPVLLSHEDGYQKTPQFKSVGKVVELPLVADAVSLAKSTMELPLVADAVSLAKSTLSPLVETVTPVAEKVEEQVASFKARAEESLLPQVSEGVKTNLTSAVEQVSSAVASLDNLACGGLDQLTERVPLLRGPTPDVLETTKEVATSCIGLLAEYLASFTLAQMALKVGEASLSMIDSTLKKTGMEKKMPVNIGNVRREARALRRAGVRRAAVDETSTAKTIGEVSLLGAVAEIMGVNFFLSIVGLQLVPSNEGTDEEAATFDMGKGEETDSDAEDEMTLQQRLSPERLDAYESDKDPDYSPSEASEDSLEYNSDAEEVAEPIESAVDVVYEDRQVVDSDEDMPVQQRLSPEKLAAYESDKDPDYSPSEASDDSMEYASDVEEVVQPAESAVLYEDEHATVIAEAVVEQEPVVVDTESGDVVDDETRDCETEDPAIPVTPATPLIDTRGFVAVSAAVAALEAATIPEKIIPKETALTEDPAEVLESADSSKNYVVPEASVNYETKKVIVTEATEEIEIVDISNDKEACLVDDNECALTEDPAEVHDSADSSMIAVVAEASANNETKKPVETEATEEIEIVDIDNDEEVCVVDDDEGALTEDPAEVLESADSSENAVVPEASANFETKKPSVTVATEAIEILDIDDDEEVCVVDDDEGVQIDECDTEEEAKDLIKIDENESKVQNELEEEID